MGEWLPHAPVRAAAASVVLLSILWHAVGHFRFPGDRHGLQANRDRALMTRTGRLYFGFLLGLGVLTRLTTPLVYALLLVVAASRSASLALAAGLGFGLGRTIPAFVGVAVVGASRDVFAASHRILMQGRLDRLAGVATGSALALLLILA
jgi:hypothetical protein